MTSALPIELATTRSPIAPGPYSLAPRKSNGIQSILVVDDDEMTRVVVARLLAAEGYEVITARNGREALEVAGARQPDLVIMDVVMPGLNGFEVCNRLKLSADTRRTPVLMVTGLREIEDRVAGLDAGADDFLAKPFAAKELVARVGSLLRMKGYADQLERAEAVVTMMAQSIESRDPSTAGHCERLAAMASELGRRMGLPVPEIEALRLAGTLHDVGKISVPDAILLKPGPLTSEEWTVMREHPVRGEAICRPINSFQLVLPIIRHHHERLNGSGYPDGLGGEQVPTTARILQVADVFDAITTNRPYKPALDRAEAFRILETETGWGWWDAAVVSAFRAMMEADGVPSLSSRGEVA